MTSDLRPELLTPTPPYVWRLLLGSVIASIGAVVMAVGYQARGEPPRVAIALRESAMDASPEADSITRELAPLGITINNILPGSIRTDRTVELAEIRSSKENIPVERVLEERAREIPAGRLGEPDEIGATVAFLCSRQAAYITGTSITVDGGLTRAL